MPLSLPSSKTSRILALRQLAASLTLCAIALSASGQSDGASAANRLTVNARLVVLDVVVTDAKGQPVDNLSAGDFQVFEDGKQQQIRSLELPSAHTLPAGLAVAGENLSFDPAKPANFGQSPVTILVLDQLNTHFADSSFARRSLRDFLLGQPKLLPTPTTLFNVSDSHFHSLQGYTRDRDALLHALAAAPTEYAWKLEINGKSEYGPIERLDQSLRALEQIAQANARVPGRKNLVWVGGGFPTLDPTTIDRDDAQEVKNALRHLTDVMLDTRITLYAVDPTSSAAGMSEITDETQQAFADAAGDSLGGGFDSFGAGDDFDKLGPATGGRVVRGLNNVASQIASSVDLGTHFYTLAYSPSSASEASAKFRAINVVCLRPGLKATTRLGYFPGQAVQGNTAATAAYDLTTAAESSIPLNGLRVTVAPDSSVKAPPHTYLVRVSAADLTWKQKDDGAATASVYIMAVSLNAKNKMIGHTLHGMTAMSQPGVDLHDAARTAEFVFTAPPEAKATSLRFIVRDSTSGRMGSINLPAGKR